MTRFAHPFFFRAALTFFQAEQAIAKGIDTLVINKDTTKTTGLGNTLVQVRPWSTCHPRWLLPPVSKNYGKIPVFECELPPLWLMKPIALQSGGVRIFNQLIARWRLYVVI